MRPRSNGSTARQLVHLGPLARARAEVIVTGATRIFRIISGELVREARRGDRAAGYNTRKSLRPNFGQHQSPNCASVCYFRRVSPDRYLAIRSPPLPPTPRRPFQCGLWRVVVWSGVEWRCWEWLVGFPAGGGKARPAAAAHRRGRKGRRGPSLRSPSRPTASAARTSDCRD